MKTVKNGMLVLCALALITSCAGPHYDRFNTQRGAAIGAGFGALAGQLIGRIEYGEAESVDSRGPRPDVDGGEDIVKYRPGCVF